MTAPKRQKLRRDELAARLRGQTPAEVAFPTSKWRDDIIGFARDVLGIAWLSPRQTAVLTSFQKGTYITIRGGRKSGKTRAAAICAWWYVCTFPESRVVMTAPTEDSVEKIIWRDIQHLYNTAPVSLGGDLHIIARTGWRDGSRGIYGRVARDAGGIRGLSGANVCYILDEASDIPDEIWETISGNMAGGVGGDGDARASRALLVSNPSKLQGFFFDSHTRDIRWAPHRHHMPAEARDDVPGMATSEWLQQVADYYGTDSSYHAIHVRGEFPTVDEARVVSEALLAASEARWDAAPAGGDLCIGVDPATSENNDEAAFAVRRGTRIVALRTFRGQSYEQLGGILCDLLDEFRINPRERGRVVLDADGPIGEGTLRAVRPLSEAHNFRLITLHYSDFRAKFPVLARSYGDMNGARWGLLVSWLREGGAVLVDPKLHDELLAPSWVINDNGKRKVTRKDELRDMLKRSPDRADAVINACWQADPAAAAEVPRRESTFGFGAADDTLSTILNPYQAEATWRRR